MYTTRFKISNLVICTNLYIKFVTVAMIESIEVLNPYRTNVENRVSS